MVVACIWNADQYSEVHMYYTIYAWYWNRKSLAFQNQIRKHGNPLRLDEAELYSNFYVVLYTPIIRTLP